MPQSPAFIAFTGVDRADLLPELVALSARYPIEWGLLVDPAQETNPLFPDATTRAALLAAPLRWAAHVCGQSARDIVARPDTAAAAIGGVQRVQVNHSRTGSEAEAIEATVRFGRRMAVRTVLQCGGAFPSDTRTDWLYDISFGTGVKPTTWAVLDPEGAFCGYSGGIGPQTVRGVLDAIAAPPGALYWIDMESGVRTDGWFDLAKARAVCEAVFGAR
jgi:hypothetical protein